MTGVQTCALPILIVFAVVCALLEATTVIPLALMQARLESVQFVAANLGMLVLRVALTVLTVVGFGWGVNSRWFTELYAKWHKEPGDRHRFDAWEWENRFQMAQPGEAWADLGLLAEYERSRGGGPDEIAFGPLLEKDIGASTENLNVIVEHQIGRHDEHGFNLTYRAQARWRLYETFEPALQMFGEFGAVGDMPAFAAQEHAIGPAVLGRWRLGTLPGRIGYDIGYLFGVTKDTTDGALKAIVEYEFQF